MKLEDTIGNDMGRWESRLGRRRLFEISSHFPSQNQWDWKMKFPFLVQFRPIFSGEDGC